MKILCILGSPRQRANSSLVADRFCRTAQELGAEVRTFKLNDLKYRGCQACMACKTRLDKCALKDDLTEVLEALAQADVLVMASPVYYGEVSSQLKGFIDRTFSFAVPDYITNPVKSRLSPGKKLVMILAQANPQAGAFNDIFARYDFFFGMHGFEKGRLIHACGVMEAGDVENLPEVMSRAEEAAHKLCSN